jgi:hypothetical protein
VGLLRSIPALPTNCRFPASTNPNSAAPSNTGSNGGFGPAAFFTLSDQAKANLAAADRLQAYAEAHRASGNDTSAVDSLQSVLDSSSQAAGTPATVTQPTPSASELAAEGAQIPTIANGNAPQSFQPFTPTKNLSKSVTYDGYTLTLDANAGTQGYGIEVSGNGVQAYDKHFGPSDGISGATVSQPGVEVSVGIPNSNDEAVDAITISQNTAAASTASISSSSAGLASTSSVNAQSSSVTFLVNYATGQIVVQQSAASVSAQSTQASSPGSIVSTLA